MADNLTVGDREFELISIDPTTDIEGTYALRPVTKKQEWKDHADGVLVQFDWKQVSDKTAQAVSEAIKALLEAVNAPFDIPELNADTGMVSEPLLKLEEAVEAARKARSDE